jgi:hypothetical protein
MIVSSHNGPDVLSLGEFLASLEDRLRALTADELQALLLGHAERLPAQERNAFLAIFAAKPSAVGGPNCLPNAGHADTDLLADIDSFAGQVRSGAYFEGWGWDDDLHEERAWGDESWVDQMDDLFARAAEVFLAGDMHTAQDAYARLLDAFGLDEEVGTFCGPGAASEMVSTDIGEAVARYLRALYETASPGERAGLVHERYADLHHLAGSLSLRAIAGTRREELPSLDLFLPPWIDVLAEHTDGVWLRDRQRLLTEAATWRGGVDGLAAVARRPGTHQPTAYLDWIDGLVDADRLGDAAAAAQEGLALAGLPAERAADIADRLAAVIQRQGDAAASLEARRHAWRTAPTRPRLLALVTAAEDTATLEETLAAEADHPTGAPDRLTAELLLLAGRVDEAAARLANTKPLGWFQPGHPGAVVLPYLMVAATGQPPPPVTTQLGRQFAAIDTASTWDPLMALRDPREGDYGIDGRISRAVPSEPVTRQVMLSALLAERLPAQASPTQRDRWLAAARAAVEQRVAAVVTNKYRGAYARAAEIAVAYAESLTMCHDAAAGVTYLAQLRAQYPRHVAFRGELDTATRTSSLLPAPLARRR